jgi:hypothetical protein
VQKKTLGKELLCRVPKKQSVKTFLAEYFFTLGKEDLCRVFFLPSVFNLALYKELLYRVPEKKTFGKSFSTRQSLILR